MQSKVTLNWIPSLTVCSNSLLSRFTILVSLQRTKELLDIAVSMEKVVHEHKLLLFIVVNKSTLDFLRKTREIARCTMN